MAKTTQERYSRKKTNTASQTNTERNSHYKSETKKQQEAKNTKVNVADRNSHYNSETYKENKPKVETKVEPKVETKVEPKVETKVEPKKEKKQSKTSTERNSHYDSSKIYDEINETVKKEPLQLDQETFNTWMDTATGRQGTQREKQEPGDQKLMKMAGNIVGGMVNAGFKGYDIGKEFINSIAVNQIEHNRDNYLKMGMTDEEIDEWIRNKNDAFDINDENNWSNLIDKQIEKNRETIYKDTNAVEQFALQTVEGAGQFGAHMLLAMATGGSSLVTMGLQAGTEKAYQNIQEGYDTQTAIGNGVMTGIMTALVEKLPVDNFGKLVTSPLSQFSLAAIASQAISEGAEEGLEYLIEPQIDRLMLGKEVEYNAGDLFMSIALGMSSGGLIGTVGNAIPIINTKIETRKQFNQLKADMETLIEYKNTNQLTEEETVAIESALTLAQKALNKFESTSVLKNAVQYESDKVNKLSAREIQENFKKFLQPQVDQDIKLNQEQQAVNSILETSQNVLAQKGIQMDALQYSKLDNEVKTEVDKIQNFANALNTNVVFNSDLVAENGQVIDGMYIPEVGIVINPNGNRKAMSTFVHELTHGTESSQYYAPLKQLIIDSNGDYAQQVQSIKNAYKTVTDLSTEGATKEYVAIKTQDMLGNEQFVDKLVKYNTSLANRIYEGIKQIVSLTNTEQDIEYNFMKAFRNNGIVEGQTQSQYSFKDVKGDEIVLDSEQIANNAKEILKMKPVAFINENKFEKDNISLVDKITTFFNQRGNIAYNETIGQVQLDRQGAKSLVAHLPRYVDKYAAIEAIPEVINKGKLIRVETNWKNRGKDTCVITAPIEVGNSRKFMSVVLEQFTGRGGLTTRYYVHDLIIVDDKKAANELHKTHISGTQDVAAYTYNILKNAQNIKYSLGFNKDSLGRTLSKEQQEFFKESALRDENGNLKPFYHGTPRADRVGYYFDPNKATSGPMAYFTDNKEIANNYARDKKDTSIAYDERYDSPETQFRVERNGKDIPVGELWKSMSYKERMDFKKKAQQLTKDWDNEDEVVLYFEEGNKYGIGNLSDYEIREKNGNVINALVHSWVTEGNLWGEEHQFLEVLKAMGIDDAYYLDPEYRDEKTYEVYLNVKNPFNTSDVDETFVESLEDFINETDMSKYNKESQHADMWDKNSVDMDDWIYKLNDDIANGTAHVWTSIPDVVTDFLKSNGYDGILDVGGKRGGDLHQVAIPFYSNQIKETSNKKPTSNPDIRYSIGLTNDNLGRTLSKEQQEYFKDSKVRDKNGNLMTVYHGTPNGEFTVFDADRIGETTDEGDWGTGFYFTDDKDGAQSYATGKDAKVYETYLNLTNPLRLDKLEEYNKLYFQRMNHEDILQQIGLTEEEFEAISEASEILEDNWQGYTIEELGFDGVIQGNDNGHIYVATNPNQIKNVTNTKPTSNKDIRYSIGLSNEDLHESRKYEREKASLLKELQGFGVTKVDANYETLYNEAISNVLKTGEVSPELYEEIKQETWDRMVDIQENPLNENAKQIREFIRSNPINIQSFNKGDFAGKEEWNEWRKKNFGIFRFSKDKGASIDTIYDEFNNMFSGLVDTSITSSYDQLMELKRVVDLVGEEGTEVHISEYGMDKETFDTFFDEKMNDFVDDIKTHENLKKFEDSIKLDTNVDVSDVEMEHLLDGKLTDTEYEKFLKLQDKMVDGASTWIPNYNIIRNKYTEFSEKNFAKALFENLVNGNVSDETRQALKNDVLYKFFGGDEASYNENPVAKNRLNEFLNDSIKNFISDAQYKSNKQYMRSIATKVNNLLRGYTDGVDNVVFENKYEQQEALKRITDMLKANRKERMGSLKEIVSALPIEGQDKVNRLRTLEQNLDLIAGGKGELRTMLREALEMPRYNAQTEYAKTLDKYNSVIADIIKNDLIREGTKESKAVQWIMETHKENGEEYDSYKLREDFNYTMANGKKAYENIESAASKLRTAYDEIFNTINTQRYSIYGDVELENQIETQKLEAKVRQQERLIEDYEQMIAKNPSAQLQSAYESALIELKKLQNQLDVKKQSDASGDSIRRQKLLYRKNYAHHIVKRKGILGTIVEGVRAIPTRLSGISDYAKPRSAYAGFFNQQAENNHDYEADAIAGFASYIKDASKVIAYDPLIDYYRSFNSDLRAMAKTTEMSKFVNYLDDYANNLAGKTEDFDRAIRKNIDKSLTLVEKVTQRVKSNALLFNFRTAFTQVYNIPNGVGVLSKNGGVETSKDFIKGALDYFTTFTNDSTERERSPFLKARFFDTDTGKQGIGATMDDIQNFMLTKGDEISTKLIWSVAYQQGLRKGVEDPIFYADDLTRRSVGGRSVGEVPLLLQSKLVNLIAPFQIETTNAFINTLDMVRDKEALPALLAMLIANWLFNEMSEELFGDRILFDPNHVIAEGIENEDSFGEIALRMGGEMLGNMPFGQYVPQFLFGMDDNEKEKIFGESDPSRYGLGNMGLSVMGNAIVDVYNGNYLDALSDVVANYGLPKGGKQLQRTIEALQTNGMLPQFENGQLVQEPIYYTGSGKVGYVTNPEAIMDSPENFFDFAKQMMFGKWAGKEAQEYIESGFKAMGKTQTNMFESLNEGMNTSDSYNMAEEVYEAKKNMTGEDGKLQFIEYLNSGEFTPEQKNEIYDTYYGDSALTVRINDFAKGTKLDADQTFKVKDILSTTVSLKDSSGESVRNSKALSIRKQLDELGLYDDVVKYINDNGLDYGDMGLNKTVGAMSNSEFQSKYKEIYGESYKAQSSDSLADAYASTFGNKSSGSKKGSTSSKKTSNKTTSSKKETNKETASTNDVFSFDEQKAKIDSILAKVYGGSSSTTSAYNKINNILNKVKSSKTKSTINIKSKYSKLIKDYLKNHPEDAHLFS